MKTKTTKAKAAVAAKAPRNDDRNGTKPGKTRLALEALAVGKSKFFDYTEQKRISSLVTRAAGKYTTKRVEKGDEVKLKVTKVAD